MLNKVEAILEACRRYREPPLLFYHAKKCKVHFVGAWDTVSSIGLIRKKKLLPGTIDGMKHVCFFRHALALDERRVKFLPEYAHGGTTLPAKHSSDAAPPTEDDDYILYTPFLDVFLYSTVVLFSFAWRLSFLSIVYRLAALYLIFRCLRFAQDMVILDSDSDSSLPCLTDLQLMPNPTPSCPGAFHLAGDSPFDIFEEEPSSVDSKEVLTLDRDEVKNNRNSLLEPSRGKARNTKPSADNIEGTTPQTLEVWFAGTHSDIGGGNVQNKGMDRSRPPLRWMVHEAGALGLRMKPFTRELSSEEHIEIKESLTGLWKFLEWLPFRRLTFDRETGGGSETYRPHHGAGRVIQPGQKVHGSLTLANKLGKSDGYTPKARLSGTLLSEIKNLKANTLGDEDFWENLGDERFRNLLVVDLEQYAEGLLHMYISEREAPMVKEQVLNVLKQIPTWNGGRQALYDACIKLLRTTGDTLRLRNVTDQKPGQQPTDNDVRYFLLKTVQTLLPGSRLNDVKLVRSGYLHTRRLATLLEDEARKHDTMLFFGRFTTKTSDSVLQTTSAPLSIAFSEDGKWLASGHNNGTVLIWDLKYGIQTEKAMGQHSELVASLSFSPDSKRLVSGSWDNTLRLWDVEKMKQVRNPLKGHTDIVNCVAFSPDGTKVVSASDDNTLRVWNPETGKEIAVLEGHGHFVQSVAFLPDSLCITSGSLDRTVQIWDAQTYQQDSEPLKGHTDYVRSVAYSPDGKHIASGSADNTICIWDAETSERVGKPLQGHSGRVFTVCFSPDGKLLASGSDDYTIRIWNPNTGVQVGEALRKHDNVVGSVAFSPDGKTLASASLDRTIRIWDVEGYVQLSLLSSG